MDALMREATSLGRIMLKEGVNTIRINSFSSFTKITPKIPPKMDPIPPIMIMPSIQIESIRLY
jgi:hypothetical protein